ncbi:MAG: universal stress protein [Alphaproteobacteria bacterium]|nr:universal stress protein [Alphaproteobacteria bacterium]
MAGLKKILVPLIGDVRDRATLETAFRLAGQVKAHCEVVHIAPDPRTTLPYLGEGVTGAVIDDYLTAAQEASDRAAARAREAFDAARSSSGLAATDEPRADRLPSVRFQRCIGALVPTVSELARLADLVVFGRTCSDEPSLTDALEECLMAAGRPILLAPREAGASIGTRVCIAWDGSAEAANALSAGLPVLAGARAVTCLTIGEKAEAEPRLASVRAYLALHGVTAESHWLAPSGEPVGERLLAEAERRNADLVIMGGYGHSRLREFILGGATRHVLANAAIPVLIAH